MQPVHACTFLMVMHPPPAPCMQVHDIEELKAACSCAKMCPYYAARELATSAELVFAPYRCVCVWGGGVMYTSVLSPTHPPACQGGVETSEFTLRTIHA